MPRMKPDTSLPLDIMSISANSSATLSGSTMGRGFPKSTILMRSVMRARIAASKSMTEPMVKGLPWCSLSMIPSNPTSSA